jgi:hypothetical protein
MSAHPHGNLDNPDTVHEESDINVSAIIWFVVVLMAIVLAVDAAMFGLFKVLDHMEVKNEPVTSPLALPAGQELGPPGLQTEPWVELKKFRAEQLAHLHGYGWVDQPGGVARVPIEKAKELLLKKGLPVRPELADALEGTAVASGGEANGGRTIPAGAADKSSPASAQPPAVATPAAPAAAVTPGKPGGGGH